ncbi:hypothetical protein DB88DRAFT_496604 [Papiliotrema laurentii]|uniref:Uncharacterized protein n=1 Tax=Papiliotrema laurentii TaxID=5418 RepID=A0AAD9CUZ6_PAPLA|nr:hypothetical protein DB88DRAFT_496604 [Papiliotrema laurentii]
MTSRPDATALSIVSAKTGRVYDSWRACWVAEDQANHPIYYSAQEERCVEDFLGVRFQPLDHVPDLLFPSHLNQFGLADYIPDLTTQYHEDTSDDPDSDETFRPPPPLAYDPERKLCDLKFTPPCKVNGDACTECKGRLARFGYTHPDAICEDTEAKGNPTVLYRFRFDGYQGQEVKPRACLACARHRRLQCQIDGKEEHRFILVDGGPAQHHKTAIVLEGEEGKHRDGASGMTMGAKTTRLGDEVAELKRASKHGEFEVQRLERRVRQLEGRSGELEGRFGELEGRVRELEDEIAALKARIGPVEEDVDKLARVATSHRGTLQYLRGQLRKLGNRQHAS